MEFCPNCKAKYKLGDVLCDQCGELLPDPDPARQQELPHQSEILDPSSDLHDTIDEDAEHSDEANKVLDDQQGVETSDVGGTVDYEADFEDESEAGRESVDLADTVDYTQQNPLVRDEPLSEAFESALDGDGTETVNESIQSDRDSIEFSMEMHPIDRAGTDDGDELDTVEYDTSGGLNEDEQDGTIELAEEPKSESKSDDDFELEDEDLTDHLDTLEVEEDIKLSLDEDEVALDFSIEFEGTDNSGTVSGPEAPGDDLDTYVSSADVDFETDDLDGDELEAEREGSTSESTDNEETFEESVEDLGDRRDQNATLDGAQADSESFLIDEIDVDDIDDFELSDDVQTHVMPPSATFPGAQHGGTVNPQDESRTVDESSAPYPARATMQPDSFDTQYASSAPASGTEGRLKRLWEGVAETDNPMASLRAIGREASETIFERVATRKVADASPKYSVHADYQILNKLGEGAMGVVLSARQAGVERVVALKTAKPNYQKSEESRRRFLYEAQITAELGHSNIVPIYELGATEQGMLFYSMKLIDGTPWLKVIKKQTREENLDIFMKVCDAMGFAHSKGVIHRDLKPENTMLGTFGEVFVTDWGTAINLRKDSAKVSKPAKKGSKYLTLDDASNFCKGDAIFFTDGEELFDRQVIDHFDSQQKNRVFFKKRLKHDYTPSSYLRATKLMTMAGTPCYMAPEMAGHYLEKLGPASDIYVLGAMLYEIVLGKPPHSGKDVADCLQAALRNEAIAIEHNDALLDIAKKAMATEPRDRYASVEELQEAVRTYRTHSESVALSTRSRKLLSEAIRNNDYEAFSRAIFGYQDALDMWPENSEAVEGLKTARLAYGRAAFEKADYDLVLQTLNASVPEEKDLIQKATVAKRKSLQREAKLKLLQRAVAAVVLIAIVGLSGLSAWAWYEKNQAEIAREAAEDSRMAELAAKVQAETARDVAFSARDAEKDAKQRAEASAREEALAKEEAIAAQREAEQALVREEMAKEKEVKARLAAQESEHQAELARDDALKQREKAQQRAAQIQLGKYQSSLALAKSQVESFDIAAARANLLQLKDLRSDVFLGQTPKFDNWAWNRIFLLSNSDLTQFPAGARPTAFSCRPEAGLLAVATTNGKIQVLRFENGHWQKSASLDVRGRIVAMALAPSGEEVAFCREQLGQAQLEVWRLDSQAVYPLSVAQGREFQQLIYLTGNKFLAGINGGIWTWDTNESNWYLQDSIQSRVSGVRGRLLSLHPWNDDEALFTASFQGETLVGLLSPETGEASMLSIDGSSDVKIVSAGPTGRDNELALGSADNRLLIGQISGERIEVSQSIEPVHRAPINRFLLDGSDRLITASENEPVLHTWKLERDAWRYESYLAGTAGNLRFTGVLGNRQVVGVDDFGQVLVWDVTRQQQRRRLQRAVEVAEDTDYVVPVKQVVVGEASGAAICIDENGVIDSWSLVDGQPNRVEQMRWSYFGHTPGAELVDSIIDGERQLVVTAASLLNAEKRYLRERSHDWEFCVWDKQTGSMLRRWTAADRKSKVNSRSTESIEQRISLLNSGRLLLRASDHETRLFDLMSGAEAFVRSDFGTYFAVPHPRNANQSALVKRSGSVRILDLSKTESWELEGYQNFLLATAADIPLRGIWSTRGTHFYLLFASGKLARFRWDSEQLELDWTSTSLESNQRHIEATLSSNGRIQSHLDIDLIVSEQAGDSADQVSIAVRNRGQRPTTTLVTVDFADAPRPSVEEERRQGTHWLEAKDGAIRLQERMHDRLLVDSNRIRSRQRFESEVFVSTRNADVIRMRDGQKDVLTYGRPKLISATGDSLGSQLFALFEGGSLWRYRQGSKRVASSETPESTSGWDRLPYTLGNADRILLSPSGERLVVFIGAEAQVVETADGRLKTSLGKVANACWNSETGELAAVVSDGTIKVFDFQTGSTRSIATTIRNDQRLVGMHFLREAWQEPEQPPKSHLVLHLENETEGSILMVPLGEELHAISEETSATEIALPVGTKLEVAPGQGVIASGTPNGTVTLWYVTPTWERKPLQLFDLEGHRGAEITALKFTSDGQTLISADAKNRVYAWMSREPQVGEDKN